MSANEGNRAAARDFARAASYWRIAMKGAIGYVGLAGLAAMLTLVQAVAVDTSRAGVDAGAIDAVLRFYYFIFWAIQAGVGLLLWLASWTAWLFTADKARTLDLSPPAGPPSRPIESGPPSTRPSPREPSRDLRA
jgi:hypothetical protein